MELRHLRYFVAVAERLNFTAAARHLGIAQPPLSIQIQKLEGELGSPLFLRQNRRVELTPAGNELLAEAREILQRADRAVLRIQDAAAGRSGEIVLACGDGALSEALTKRLRKFVRKHRGIRLRLQSPEDDPAEADGVITDFPGSDLPPRAILLEQSAIEVALPPKHRLADRPGIFSADLIGETLLVSPYESRPAAERLAFERIEADGVATAVEESRGTLQRRFWQVSLGLGVAFCSAHHRGSLDARRIPFPDCPTPIVTALVPNSASRCAALPLLAEAIRA